MRYATMVAFAVALWGQTAAAQFFVTECGVTVPDGVDAVLNADLDCSIHDTSPAVTLGSRSTFDLRGFTLTVPAVAQPAVRCCDNLQKSCWCKVINGRFLGPGGGVTSSASLIATDLVMEGAAGIRANGRVTATNLDIADSPARCVSGQKVKARNVTCTDCGTMGIVGRTVRAEDVVVTGCAGAGIDAFSGKARVKRATVTGNGTAPEAGDGSGGVIGARVVLVDSTVTGNYAGQLLTPPDTPMDVFSERKPRLVRSTCVHSGRYGAYDEPWGVCTAD